MWPMSDSESLAFSNQRHRGLRQMGMQKGALRVIIERCAFSLNEFL